MRGNRLDTRDGLSLIFALVALAGVFGGMVNRYQLKKGIGTQFIRYIAISVALPMAAALAFQGMLTEAIVTIVMGALGYAFAGVAQEKE